MDELEQPHGRVTCIPQPRGVNRFHWTTTCQCHLTGDTCTITEAWARVAYHLKYVHHIVN